jgi:hypothetical protein
MVLMHIINELSKHQNKLVQEKATSNMGSVMNLLEKIVKRYA